MTEINTIIIGAGPAGIAAAGALSKHNIPFVILEKAPLIAQAWHNHYDRLHLHTTKKRSALPYFKWPAKYSKYPSRTQLIDYLESYCEHFGIKPQFNQTVFSVKREKENKWITQTGEKSYLSENVIVATGLSLTPNLPKIEGMESYNGEVLHSSKYKNGSPWKGKDVLVVGFGNSAGEIAVDLSEHGANVSMSVRGGVNVVPRDILGINVNEISILTEFMSAEKSDKNNAWLLKLIFGNLNKYGIKKAEKGPKQSIEEDGKVPLIDIGTIKLIKKGIIKVFPGIKTIRDSGVTFENDKNVDFDAIIFGTGFLPDLNFLEGVSFFKVPGKTDVPKVIEKPSGLFFVGFQNYATGALRGMNIESIMIAKHIKNT